MEELKGGKKNICIGLLAHVDAGKTTLSEEMLHRTGVLEQAGRVDKGNAFLDTYELEKSRGITIFPSRQCLNGMKYNLLCWILRDMWIFLQKWSGHCRCWTMGFW